MTSEANELIAIIEQRGGRLYVQGGDLVIEPEGAGLPLVESLRAHKPEILAALQNRPQRWRKPFERWLNSSCLRRPRWFGGLACLHLSFCEWQSARKADPCDRETFTALLNECGFLIGEVEETALVSGLALREDVLAFEHDPAPQVRKRTAA